MPKNKSMSFTKTSELFFEQFSDLDIVRQTNERRKRHLLALCMYTKEEIDTWLREAWLLYCSWRFLDLIRLEREGCPNYVRKNTTQICFHAYPLVPPGDSAPTEGTAGDDANSDKSCKLEKSSTEEVDDAASEISSSSDIDSNSGSDTPHREESPHSEAPSDKISASRKRAQSSQEETPEEPTPQLENKETQTCETYQTRDLKRQKVSQAPSIDPVTERILDMLMENNLLSAESLAQYTIKKVVEGRARE
jgi:hypothetical protein